MDSGRAEKIATLKSICNLDDKSCANMLEAHGWDLEATVATALTEDNTNPLAHSAPFSHSLSGTGPSIFSPTASLPQSTSTSSSQPTTTSNTVQRMSPSGVSSPRPSATATATSTTSSSTSSSSTGAPAPFWFLPSFLRPVARWIFDTIAMLIPSPITNFFFGRTPQDYYEQFKTRYPDTPDFLHGSLAEAFTEARSRSRLVLVYIHCATHERTDQYCRQVLSSPSLREFTQVNLVGWFGDIRQRDGYEVSRRLQAQSFPYLALLMPRPGNKLALINVYAGTLDGDSIVADLLVRMEMAQTVEQQERNRVASEQMDRQIRQQQDREYQMALEAERAKKQSEEQKVAEEEKQRKLMEEEEEKRRAEQEAEEKAREELEQRVGEEPSAGENVVKVVVRLPESGQKVLRNFYVDSPLQGVLDWLRVKDSTLKEGKFRVLSNYPTKAWEDPSIPLHSMNLGKQILLFVERIGV